MKPQMNFHASAVVLRDRGVVITGASGAGKTQLALALISHARASGVFARLVADDQLFLSAAHGRLICTAPEAIAGLVEVRGLGPVPVVHEHRAVADLLVRLVGAGEAERFPEPDTETILGCELPRMRLAEGDTQRAALAVLARLCLPGFY